MKATKLASMLHNSLFLYLGISAKLCDLRNVGIDLLALVVMLCQQKFG